MCYGAGNLAVPLVSPLVLKREWNGALHAEFPKGVGGFLYAQATPPLALGRWSGGMGQRNQLLFEAHGALYALWSLSPSSVVVHIPRSLPALPLRNQTRGSLCCAEPTGLQPSHPDWNLRTIFGEFGGRTHLSAGLLHIPERGILLGVAHAHRDLWGSRATARSSVLPKYGSHYTHMFFALRDRPPFALDMLGPEFCLPRSRRGATRISRNAQLEDESECDVIQFVTSLELAAPRGAPGSSSASLILSYGIDDCFAAVVELDYHAVLAQLLHVSHWEVA
jgi:hypothetical protein